MRSLLLALVFAGLAAGQSYNATLGFSDPAGSACTSNNYGERYINLMSGVEWNCLVIGHWTQMNGGSGGSGGGVSCSAYLPSGQPDGTTDNTAGIQACLDAILFVGGVADLPAAAQPYVCTSLTSRGSPVGVFRIEPGATLTCAPPEPTGPIVAVTLGGGGLGYTLGDTLTITGGGGTGGNSRGQVTATDVGGGGVVTAISAISLVTTGPEAPIYSVTPGVATTGGTGTGATVNITEIGFGGFRVDDLNPMDFPLSTGILSPLMQQGTVEAQSLVVDGLLESYGGNVRAANGAPYTIKTTSVVSSSASVATTNILDATSATVGSRYEIKYKISQAAAGVGCATNATVFVTFSWTNEVSVVQTRDSAILNMAGTGTAVGAHDEGSIDIITAASTIISYATTWVNGTSCSPQPHYTLSVWLTAY